MKTNTEQDYKERMLRVLVHIQNHLDEAVSLDDLASIANFSPFHFHRVFRGMLGEGVMEHCRRLRLERAAQRLKQSEEQVTAIAFEAGYETLDAFIRAFRMRFGMPPTEFRKDCAAKIQSLPSGIGYHPQTVLQDFEPIRKGVLEMDVNVRNVPPMKVVFVRVNGPYTQSAGQAWGKLCSWAGRKGLMRSQPVLIGISHDDPEITPPDKVRYDACLVVQQEVEPEGDFGVQELGGGDYAITMHKGPYERLGETYSYLCGQWAPQNGYRLRSLPPFEIYKKDPSVAKPEDLLTEIYLPVEKVG
ncbi:MAG TPA: AraC family transcriptional regulator [bacterium]|jgi:AraC family transcriptional regulator